MRYNFLKITKETEDEFQEIAEKLFNNYAIQNHESTYRLTEIEFYWTSPKHKDESTYKRIHADPSKGEWFFHYSGVDIALKNEEIQGYGGILIRGIYDISTGKPYKGPMICAMKLFSGTNVFANSISTRIIEYEFQSELLRQTERVGLGKNAIKSGTNKLKYRFLIKPNNI